MPDLSEFMPVIVNGQVQPVNMGNLCDVEAMEEGNVPSSPVVDTFSQLLKVDGAHCLLLEEMNKPLLELVYDMLRYDGQQPLRTCCDSIVILTGFI